MNVEEYADQLIALLPPGKAFPTELDTTMRAICLAMADGLARVDEAANQLLKDVDPGGFTDESVGEIWLDLVGEESVQPGLVTVEKQRESILHKLTAGGTPTDQLIVERLTLLGVGQTQRSPTRQELGTNPAIGGNELEDILPAQVRVLAI